MAAEPAIAERHGDYRLRLRIRRRKAGERAAGVLGGRQVAPERAIRSPGTSYKKEGGTLPAHGLFLGQIFDHWSRDDVPRLAASLAYYTILSSAPLLVISIAVADRVFGQQAVQGQLAWEIQTLVGGDAAQAIQAVIRGAHRPTSGLIATILSIATLMVGASSVVVELHSALNLIWGVPDPDAGSWLGNVFALSNSDSIHALVVIGGRMPAADLADRQRFHHHHREVLSARCSRLRNGCCTWRPLLRPSSW